MFSASVWPRKRRQLKLHQKKWRFPRDPKVSTYKLVFERLAKLCFYSGDALLCKVVQMCLSWFYSTYYSTRCANWLQPDCEGAGNKCGVISGICFLLGHQRALLGLCNLWPLSAVSDSGSAERVTHKRKISSPSHSSNGHSSAETSPCPTKKKKKPGAVSSGKDQVTITWHGI